MAEQDKNIGNGSNVRLSDIATALGISKATVSLVINNDPRVSEKTRQKVLKKIKELGYIYNRGAAGLSTGRSNTIGLYPMILQAQKNGAQLIVIDPRRIPEAEKAALETIALPVYPELTQEQQDYVIETIRKFYQ